MEKIVIIGSGPAGYTAAIYASRANLSPVLFTGGVVGGQLTQTTDIENFPGFPEGISGSELMLKMQKQVERFNTKIIYERVVEVDFLSYPFKIIGESTRLETMSVIIATGATAKYLGIDSEKKFFGKGVSACATCDGFFFRDQDVLVIGGGDTALEEAMFLTRFVSKVSVVHRRDSLRASKINQRKVFENPKINFIWDSVIEEIIGTETVTGAKIKNLKSGETNLINCNGIFIAIGHHPNSEIFEKYLKCDEQKYILTKCNIETDIPGVFVAGDVADYKYRQAVSAAGMGCMAAISAERFLTEKRV